MYAHKEKPMKYQLVLRSLLDPDETQPRRSADADGIRELTESIRHHGILQPLIVYKESERFKIADGFRRFTATGVLEPIEVPVLVLESQPDADTLLLMQLAANTMREDLKPTEKAQAYQRLKDLRGLSNVEVAKLMHVSKSKVTETLSYLELSEKDRLLLDSGQIAGSTAYAISRATDEETRSELLSKAARGELRREDATKLVSQANSGRSLKERLTFRLSSAEICVAVEANLDLPHLVLVLQELGRECRRATKMGINVKTLGRVLTDKNCTPCPHPQIV